MCRQTRRYGEQGTKGTVHFAGLVAVTAPGTSLARRQRQCQNQESQQCHRHTYSLIHFHSTWGEAALGLSLPNREGGSRLMASNTVLPALLMQPKNTYLTQEKSVQRMKLSVLRLKTRATQSSCHITPVWRRTDFWAYPTVPTRVPSGLIEWHVSTHESLVNVEKCRNKINRDI